MNITMKQRTKFNAASASLMKAVDHLEYLSNEPGLTRSKLTLMRLRDETLARANELNKCVQKWIAEEVAHA